MLGLKSNLVSKRAPRFTSVQSQLITSLCMWWGIWHLPCFPKCILYGSYFLLGLLANSERLDISISIFILSMNMMLFICVISILLFEHCHTFQLNRFSMFSLIQMIMNRPLQNLPCATMGWAIITLVCQTHWLLFNALLFRR